MRNYSGARVVSKGAVNVLAPEGLDKHCSRIDHRCVILFDMDVLGGAHAVLLWLMSSPKLCSLYSENKFFCGGPWLARRILRAHLRISLPGSWEISGDQG